MHFKEKRQPPCVRGIFVLLLIHLLAGVMRISSQGMHVISPRLCPALSLTGRAVQDQLICAFVSGDEPKIHRKI